jgi:hypothetical protein
LNRSFNQASQKRHGSSCPKVLQAECFENADLEANLHLKFKFISKFNTPIKYKNITFSDYTLLTNCHHKNRLHNNIGVSDDDN